MANQLLTNVQCIIRAMTWRSVLTQTITVAPPNQSSQLNDVTGGIINSLNYLPS